MNVHTATPMIHTSKTFFVMISNANAVRLRLKTQNCHDHHHDHHNHNNVRLFFLSFVRLGARVHLSLRAVHLSDCDFLLQFANSYIHTRSTHDDRQACIFWLTMAHYYWVPIRARWHDAAKRRRG